MEFPYNSGYFSMISCSDCGQQSRSSKVKGTQLPQEFHLMKLIANMSNLHSTWKPDVPLAEWEGITLDAKGNVIQIAVVVKLPLYTRLLKKK